MLEKELFEPVSCLFSKEGYRVDAEVNGCDVVAVKDGETVIIELKTSFNLSLVHQIVKRQAYADKVYGAVPRPAKGYRTKAWKDAVALMRRLEAGLLVVFESGGELYAEVALEPTPYDVRKNNARSRKLEKELSNRTVNCNIGGSVKTGLMTAYKENALFIACCINALGAMFPREIALYGTGDKTGSILSKNFSGWFVRNAEGKYDITEKGKAAIDKYSELSKHYTGKMKKNN